MRLSLQEREGISTPCDSIVLNQIEWSAAQNHLDLLKAALEAKGYTVSRSGQSLSFYGNGTSGTYRNGKFVAREGFEMQADEIKQEFGRQVVRHAAKKHGWSVVEKGNGKLQIKKRV